MYEIRQNQEEEKFLAYGTFKLPSIFKFFYFFAFALIAIFLIIGISDITALDPDSFFYETQLANACFFLAFGVVGLILTLVFFVMHVVGLNQSSCIITNKCIKGVSKFIVTKRYSYRLDEIDNVELVSTLGIYVIQLNFTQGHIANSNPVKYNQWTGTFQANNTFRISNLVNGKELYAKLTDLLTNVKNEKETLIELEAKKVSAFEKMANNSPSQPDEAEQLKKWKTLLDLGIITKAEFEKKKKEILK